MNKYYSVPVRDCLFEHDGLNLRDHLWYVAKDMYDKDCAFREFVYGEIFDTSIGSKEYNQMLEKHESEIAKMSENKKIPHRFIIVDNGQEVYELITKEEFNRLSIEGMADQYEISAEEVVDLYEEEVSYAAKVRNFFKLYSNNKKISPDIETSEFRIDPIDVIRRSRW